MIENRLPPAGRIYILFNKPYGTLSQFTPCAGHTPLSVYNFPPAVYCAGRLDHDSEGLLFLTTDGELKHLLCTPQFGHPRTYLAQVENIPDGNALRALQKGLMLRDGPTKPCKARLISPPDLPERVPPVRFRKTVPTAWVEITLTEGRNRQVRRMFANIGFPVLRLVRSQIGTFTAQGLEQGQWRYLSKEEEKKLAELKNSLRRGAFKCPKK